MEEQEALARAGQNVLFLADWGEGDQEALLGSAMPVRDGIRSCTKSTPPLLRRRSIGSHAAG